MTSPEIPIHDLASLPQEEGLQEFEITHESLPVDVKETTYYYQVSLSIIHNLLTSPLP